MDANEHETVGDTARRLYAWEVFLYFERNKSLLEDEENLKLYNKAKEIWLSHYAKKFDEDFAKKVMLLLAQAELEKKKSDFVPMNVFNKLLLFGEIFED